MKRYKQAGLVIYPMTEKIVNKGMFSQTYWQKYINNSDPARINAAATIKMMNKDKRSCSLKC